MKTAGQSLINMQYRRNCKKQWNLDKQRAKKKAAAKAPETKEKTAAQKEAFATKPIVKRRD